MSFVLLLVLCGRGRRCIANVLKGKTWRAFIHKKDAALACYVIHRCINKDIPVYTVYENFISPTIHARKMGNTT